MGGYHKEKNAKNIKLTYKIDTEILTQHILFSAFIKFRIPVQQEKNLPLMCRKVVIQYHHEHFLSFFTDKKICGALLF